MPQREYENCIVLREIAIEHDESRLAAGNDQLTQSRFHGATDQRVTVENRNGFLNAGGRGDREPWVLLRKVLENGFEVGERALRIGYARQLFAFGRRVLPFCALLSRKACTSFAA
jgi:hypothetical protein